jgi:hypothetical protein
MSADLPYFPGAPFRDAFAGWRATPGRISHPVEQAWAELVGVVTVREVLFHGGAPDAPAFDRSWARSMAWEDLDMGLRGGGTGLLRLAVERLWMRVRTAEARAALGAAWDTASAVARAEAERSGWRSRYRVADLARPVLTNPHALELADPAEVYEGRGSFERRRARLAGEPDLDALRARLFGTAEPRGGPTA